MLWALVSAPTGIVRALDRFDMAVYVEALVPIGRLGAAIAISLTGPTVGRFLFAWAVVDLLEAACYWAMARWLCPKAVRLRHARNWRQALRDNPGIERFFAITYAGATLDAAMRSGPLLAVGGLVGTKAAGLYRLSNQVSQAMSKLSTLLTRAVYAEVNRARVAAEAGEFRRLARQTSIVAAAAGAAVVALAVAIGKPILILLGGEDFARGYPILVPLTVAAAFDLASVAFEPVLHSTGHAQYSLAARLMAVVVMAATLVLTIEPYGAVGAAWAVAAGGLVSYLAMGIMARRTLHAVSRASGADNRGGADATLDETMGDQPRD
jgi:O-antigen/teichoic acid export membrane protein